MRTIWLSLVILLLTNCTSTKEVAKTEVRIDSVAVMQRDSLRVQVRTQEQRHKRELAEVKRTSVRFDKVPCPPSIIKIDSTCNKDSMATVIRNLATYISSLKNKVTVLADGSAVYEGQIISFKSDLSKVESATDELWAKYNDSIRVMNSLRTELSKTDTVLTKNVKRKAGLWWLLIPIAFAGGFYVAYRMLGGNKRRTIIT